MSELAIKVERLGKEFIIGHKKEGDLRNAFGERIRQLFNNGHSSKESFWALKDISFEVKKGEAVGIIGRNGAGKSTLLKILSRISEPTTGRFEIDGRVSSLLEVGTGFHMELTGRENIFLNGTILGMTRKEIKAKFDEIVAFSGVEKFIDTPVKHYSSGMKVRLAFSVAAHLEPEILIIDEVLAVGDAEFQKKCLGKMNEVSKNEGRTVIFVSHNMGAIQSLCTYGILLEQGEIKIHSNVSDAIIEYFANIKTTINQPLYSKKRTAGLGFIKLYDFWIENQNGNRQRSIQTGCTFKFIIKIKGDFKEMSKVNVRIKIKGTNGQLVAVLNNYHTNNLFDLSQGSELIECLVRKWPLVSGSYIIDLQLLNNFEVQDEIENAATIIVDEGDFYGTGKVPNFQNIGLIEHKWIISSEK